MYGALGVSRSAMHAGDYSDQAALIMSGRYDIALLTYEMFLAVALSSPTVLMQLGLVVVDEGQFITDPNRGIVVELLLTLVIRARNRASIRNSSSYPRSSATSTHSTNGSAARTRDDRAPGAALRRRARPRGRVRIS